jgi:hypothetical protein
MASAPSTFGEVEAETESEAYSKACHEFGIKADWQRRRVFVRRHRIEPRMFHESQLIDARCTNPISRETLERFLNRRSRLRHKQLGEPFEGGRLPQLQGF